MKYRLDLTKLEPGMHIGGPKGEIVTCLHCEKPACLIKRKKDVFHYAHHLVIDHEVHWLETCRSRQAP